MDITQLRQQIDAVDQQLLELFVRRMEISSQIADYKKEYDLPVFDPVRERSKLADVASKVDPQLENASKVLYSLLFELSRSYQSAKNATQTPLFRQITHAIESTAPLFPRQAMVACVGSENQRLQYAAERMMPTPQLLHFHNSEAVFSAVEQGMCRYGLLPMDSADLYDQLRRHRFFIVRSMGLFGDDGQHSRFLLFSKELEIYPGADRTALVMVLSNRPGSLYRVLARLYALGLNVAKLDSRPCPGEEYRIRFYFDLETSIYAQEFVRLLCELDDLCDDFQYLGSYTEVV